MLLINLRSGISSYFTYNKPLPEYDETGPEKPEWEKYLGKYKLFLGNVLRGQFDVVIENGYLTINNQRCFEHLPAPSTYRSGQVQENHLQVPSAV